MKRHLLQLATMALTLPVLHAGVIMFGGNGGHPDPTGAPLSINNGWIVIVDQTTGAVTPIGHPAGVGKLSGLAFELNGDLYGSALTSVGFPPPVGTSPTATLVKINPATGALIASIGAITVGRVPLQIADLAVQPGTGKLFGISASSSGDSSAAGNLYTIDINTGAATLVGATGDFFGSIAFGPTGTLYMHAADLDNTGNIVNMALKTLNPLTAATLTSLPTTAIPGALAVRPDGIIFAGEGDDGQIYTLSSITGAATVVGNTGLNFVGDLAFQPVPEPASLAICGLGLFGLMLYRRRRG